MADALIKVENLHFQNKNQKIFNGHNIEIVDNEFIGIVGVNGVGKSTLLKIILGFLNHQQGQITILGKPKGDFTLREKLSASMQSIHFPPQLRVLEVLNFVRSQYTNPLSEKELIEDFDLKSFTNKNCGSLSGGMMRKLSLACSFCGQPEIIILDEATTGLDAPSRTKILNTIKSYQKKNHALVLMISHHPDEITNVVDRFVHIKPGGDIDSINPQEVTSLSQAKRVSFSCSEALDFKNALNVKHNNGSYEIITQNSDEVVKILNQKTQDYKQLLINPLDSDEIMNFFVGRDQ
ncbi:MAG: ABC transporter ATP-binding protein [Bdellovibrionales bacterium]|nr:ABC transporter ATP-binding protein [Bdellovibrionales bacterium]NQZ19302.1 ABC transporter ATP-binding protein [Bdellovibrionales bacterium]